MPVLKVEGLVKDFGGIRAIKNLDFSVQEGQIKAVIGPNGAGKTTLFNLISGLFRPTKGKIFFEDIPIHGLTPHEICKLGIGRTFQIEEMFGDMTVFENIMLGRHVRSKYEIFINGLKTRRAKREEALIQNKSHEILELLGLVEHKNDPASKLPYGKQRLVSLGRALATCPKILLLDEPAAGLNESETRLLGQLLLSLITNMKLTILLIEHNMRLVMEISHEILVLNYGEKIMEGPPDKVKEDPRVIEVYLG
jgi:branched-chain amino acid transport system ATP-binding protein